MAQYTYDEVGRTKAKKLGTETSNYSYNVRSWLAQIEGAKFNQTLVYNQPINGITPTKALYNGNISAMKWKAGTETTERGYKFTYDNLSRLTDANYGEGTSIASNLNRFNEKLSYDKMGNIMTLQRRGKVTSSTYSLIDNLTYTYTGNKLTKVYDAVTTPITNENTLHFVDGANVENEYTYDNNGNQIKDLNKNITSITYNYLNLPNVITFADGNSITYDYDANGSKLSVAYKIGDNITKTEYVGNKVYKNGTLSMILTEEGYITLSGAAPTYHYFLKDHQGNNRVVINQSGTVEQVNHYYPFGGLFGEGMQYSNQPYKYNGKEFDNLLGLNMYDYGARHYDPYSGRWIAVDPLVEKYYSISPYVYVVNNPVRFIDPDGRDIWEINEEGRIIKRTADKTQDTFYMVAKDPDGDYQRTFTTDAEGNKNYNSISFEYGTIIDAKKSSWFRSFTRFTVDSESSGAELFCFFADNTKIEYGLINTQNDGSTVMTNHNETSVSASGTAQKMSDKGQTIISVVHNHPEPYSINPSGFRPKDKSGDKFAARMFVPNAERYVYQNGKLVAYDGKSVIGTISWGLVFRPSTARKHPVYPIRQYPGVGLPPP